MALLLRLQKLLFGRRGLAVLVMTLLLFLLFIIPIALLVNSLVDSSGPVIRAVTSGDLTLPDLGWLNSIPVVGAKLYSGWHSLLEMGGSALMAKVRPYIGTTTTVCRSGRTYRPLYDALYPDAGLQRPALLAR